MGIVTAFYWWPCHRLSGINHDIHFLRIWFASIFYRLRKFCSIATLKTVFMVGMVLRLITLQNWVIRNICNVNRRVQSIEFFKHLGILWIGQIYCIILKFWKFFTLDQDTCIIVLCPKILSIDLSKFSTAHISIWRVPLSNTVLPKIFNFQHI